MISTQDDARRRVQAPVDFCYAVRVSADQAAIVQSDRSVLLELDHPGYERARAILARIAELEKSPEHVHTYRLSDLALWNAAAAGLDPHSVVEDLASISRYALPEVVRTQVVERMSRHGVCVIHDTSDPAVLRLSVSAAALRERLAADAKLADRLRPAPDGFVLGAIERGPVKQALLGMGYPVDDRAGLDDGDPIPISLRRDVFSPYPYQERAARDFLDAGAHGVVALACGGGKTVVAMLAMASLSRRCLVLTSGQEACSQWKRELLHKTSLTPDDVAIYSAQRKDIGPVTITTYSMVGRRGGDGPTGYRHFDRLGREAWGLIVYDEVHLLPAPVFRLTAQIQARRRLGLTATLVREDGREGDVFALIGPCRAVVPWRELESSGHIAAARCFEVRVGLAPEIAAAYAVAGPREQPRIAGDNPRKLEVVQRLCAQHQGDRVLIMGSYLDGLSLVAKRLSVPVVTGKTPHTERERLYRAFRRGEIRTLALSKVGNFAIDLPDANVLVQVSGTMGSRQEEAQRLGRVLRPKPGGATFYTIVSRDTCEQERALHRQMFLTEQGYRYFIEDADPGDADAPQQTLH
jgi:DNA excision repair protein ERCC-3